MASSSYLDQAMLHSKNLGKCTNVHDDSGPDFDECLDFDSKKPSKKYCGACGCYLRFHVTSNLDSRVDVALDPKSASAEHRGVRLTHRVLAHHLREIQQPAEPRLQQNAHIHRVLRRRRVPHALQADALL